MKGTNPRRSIVATSHARPLQENAQLGDDAVLRAYLGQIGSVALLTREQEFDIGARIEHGRNQVLDAVLQTTCSVREILRLGALLEDGQISLTVEELANASGLSIEQVRQVLRLSKQTISLETPTGEEGDGRLGDVVSDAGARDPERGALERNLHDDVTELLSTLTPREQKILRMRFGVGERDSHTLEEIGASFNVTRERIRQIEAKALAKLRRSSCSTVLKEHY